MSKRIFITSWSTDDLTKLINPMNHKLIFDGYEYYWYHKINYTRWELHYIKPFQDINIYNNLLHATIYKWNNELEARKVKTDKLEAAKLKEKKKNINKIIKISKRSLKTVKKLKLILEIDNSIEDRDIYKALNISKATFYRHIKNLKK